MDVITFLYPENNRPLFVLITLTVVLSACAGMTPSTQDQHTELSETASAQAAEPESSTTIIVSISTIETSPTMPTPTRTPGPSPTSPTTPAFELTAIADDFLLGARTPDCILPCWQGLVPGESSAEDVVTVFNTVLGFAGAFDLETHSEPSADVPELIRIGNFWYFDQAESQNGSFGVNTWINNETQRMEAISLEAHSYNFKPYSTPQHVLRMLGTPDYMVARVEISESAAFSGLDLFIIYQEGITIQYYTILLPTVHTQDPGRDLAEFCLNDFYQVVDDPYWYDVSIYLTGSYPDDFQDLSPFQEYYVGRLIDRLGLVPFEEIFGTTLEEITRLAVEQENACVYVSLP